MSFLIVYLSHRLEMKINSTFLSGKSGNRWRPNHNLVHIFGCNSFFGSANRLETEEHPISVVGPPSMVVTTPSPPCPFIAIHLLCNRSVQEVLYPSHDLFSLVTGTTPSCTPSIVLPHTTRKFPIGINVTVCLRELYYIAID
jgi:hypothetical protein